VECCVGLLNVSLLLDAVGADVVGIVKFSVSVVIAVGVD
jgi:hypothetical protein